MVSEIFTHAAIHFSALAKVPDLCFDVFSGLPADTLQGHRDRFQEQFKKYAVHTVAHGHFSEATFTLLANAAKILLFIDFTQKNWS